MPARAATATAVATTPSGRQARERVRVTVYLDEPLAEWGKRQEGGLSELLRRLLLEARQEQGGSPQHYPAELMEPYRVLIDRKLARGLTPEEERDLLALRERMNAYDRAQPSWERSEALAAAIDDELADLRRLLTAGK